MTPGPDFAPPPMKLATIVFPDELTGVGQHIERKLMAEKAEPQPVRPARRRLTAKAVRALNVAHRTKPVAPLLIPMPVVTLDKATMSRALNGLRREN